MFNCRDWRGDLKAEVFGISNPDLQPSDSARLIQVALMGDYTKIFGGD
jgi:hypothetical protein